MTAPVRPLAAVQLREALEEQRAAGVEFREAWRAAWKSVVWPHATPIRREWKLAILSAKLEFAAAYCGEPTPMSERIALLRDANLKVEEGMALGPETVRLAA